MSIRGHYDREYSQKQNLFGAGQPEPIVIKAADYLRSGSTVLEFGAGQGRNSLFLATKGFEVTATDISPVAVDQMKASAQQQNLKNFRALVVDSRSPISGDYDAVVSTFMLHNLQRQDALEFIERIKQHTKAKGLNILRVFTRDGDFFRANPETQNCYFGSDELKQLYGDWKVIGYKELEGRAAQTHKDGSPMFNVAAQLLAQKP